MNDKIKFQILDCREFAKNIETYAKELIEEHNLENKVSVVVIKMNEDSSSNTYVNAKCRKLNNNNIKATVDYVDVNKNTDDLIEIINKHNKDESITGIVLQMPVPKHIDVFKALEAIDPLKDLDCLTSTNIGLLIKNKPRILPATPKGIMHLFNHLDIMLTGKNVLMLGRSEIVGLPLSILLQQSNSTVTLAHSKSCYDPNNYDIVISAIGQAESILVTNPNTICIDVGINFIDGVQVGDFDIKNPKFNCKFVTSPKGGTGAITSSTICLSAVELLINKYTKN